jgi:hypothetical protein
MSKLTLYPPDDHAEFMSLKPPVRARVWQLFDAAAIIAATGKGKTEEYKRLATEMKCSFNALYQPVNAFLKSGDWRALVDRRQQPELWLRKQGCDGLPHDFVQFWKDCVESNPRSASVAYDFIILRLEAWRKGDASAAIPGYHRPPVNAAGKPHPRNWSYRNLCRHTPTDIELAAAHDGRREARKLVPGVITTRKTGYPLQELQFDDMWHDFHVIHGTQLTRILEFNAVDWYSTYIFNPGLKPRLNMDGVNKALTEKDFRLYAVTLLYTVGWSPRGTRLQGERGTAAFRSGLADRLRHWSNGLLTIPLPGMSGTPALAGGFSEIAKGNPNAKALKEGRGKIIHNYLAALPGQTGMNPDDQPASIHGRNQETMQLLSLQGMVKGLQLSHQTFEEGVRAICHVNDLINRRWDHDNEGWVEENLITQDFLADPSTETWLPLANIPADQRGAFQIIAMHSPNLLRTRRMTPLEVITPALQHTIKLTPEAMFDCIYEDVRRVETVNSGLLEFRDKDIGPGVFRYKAQYQGRDGFTKYLQNSEVVHLVVNPFHPELAGIFKPNGQYLGATRRHHDVVRGDVDAIHRRIGEVEGDFKTARLAAEYRHGLKRENQLNTHAKALLDSLSSPAPLPAPAPSQDLMDEYEEAACVSASPASYANPNDLL